MRNKEIDLIRSILIVFVIAFHACCPYFAKTWVLTPSMSEEYRDIYTYIGHTLYNGMLEMYVLLSGFLYANTLKSKLTLFFCKKKILHLYVPCILWGCIYSFFFCADFNIINILNGIGHLWFLPMLMWLFLIERQVNKLSSIGCNDYHIFIILSFITIVPFPTLPLGLNISLYYLLFFHCGVYLHRNYKQFKSKIQAINMWHILTFVLCCTFAIVAITELDSAAPEQSLPLKMLLISRAHLIHCFGAIAVIPLYWKFATIISRWANNRFILSLARCSFGIYILQEFGLRLLYYNTPFCAYFGNISPILSLLVVLITSWILTTIMMRYHITKFTIGS